MLKIILYFIGTQCVSRKLAEEKAVYLGDKWLKETTLFVQPLNWQSAYRACISEGSKLPAEPLTRMALYFRTKAYRQLGEMENDVWLGPIKDPISDIWMESSKCLEQPTWEISGQRTGEVQCAAINMSIVTLQSNIIYAAPCNKELSFLCSKNKGLTVEGSIEEYHQTIISNIGFGYTVSKNATSFQDCKSFAFDKFYRCFASTYNWDIRLCIASCTNDITDMPEKISLTSVITNTTLLLRNQSKLVVDISSSFPSIDNTDLPCSINVSTSTPSYQTTQIPCSYNVQISFTEEQLLKKIQEMKSKLILNRTFLSSSKRRKISATDGRFSSRAIGFVGAAFLIGTALTIILGDIEHVRSYFKRSACKTRRNIVIQSSDDVFREEVDDTNK